MKTILIFGASTAHGVGGEHGGWANRVKADYTNPNASEWCMVYELGIPGNTARDVADRFEAETLARLPKKDPKQTFILFSAGTNDSRAIDEPNKYIHTPDEYATNVQAFIQLSRQHAEHTLCIGLTPVDQPKTNPKLNPLTGSSSYFTNSRIKRFEEVLFEVCEREGVLCVPLFDSVPEDWTEQYLFTDGMHPNAKGYDWIYSKVKTHIDKIMGQS